MHSSFQVSRMIYALSTLYYLSTTDSDLLEYVLVGHSSELVYVYISLLWKSLFPFLSGVTRSIVLNVTADSRLRILAAET